MKWAVVLGGLIIGGAVGASIVLGDRSQAAADRPTSIKEISRQALASSGRGVASPSALFAGGFSSPAEVKAAFKKQGEEWTTANLLKFDAANRSNCPGEGAGSPSRTLYIRYVTDYPQNAQGQPTVLYTDINVPGAGGGEFMYQTPDVTEKVIRDDYEWKRNYQKRWWSGTDQNWKADMVKEQERLSEALRQAQRKKEREEAMRLIQQMAQIQMNVQQNTVQSLNEEVNDIVEVEAPSTAWSFKYNNDTKKGDPLYRRQAQPELVANANLLRENAEELAGVLDPIRQFGENIIDGGTRTILGYECTVQQAGGWDAEACMADINGEKISLWTRINKAESTAVYIDTSPCVPMAQFLPPPDVEFDEEW